MLNVQCKVNLQQKLIQPIKLKNDSVLLLGNLLENITYIRFQRYGLTLLAINVKRCSTTTTYRHISDNHQQLEHVCIINALERVM